MTRKIYKPTNQRWSRGSCLLMAALLMGPAFARAQDTFALDRKVTVKARNEKLSNVLEDIEKQTKVNFVFDGSQLNRSRTVTLQASGVPLQTVLKSLLDEETAYRVVGNQVILRRQPTAANPAEKVVVQEKTVTIRGRVGIRSKTAVDFIPGVTVRIKGTQRGVNTNTRGEFQIQAPENATLVVSFIGYKTLEVKTTGENSVSVVLEEDIARLNETVVIGYQEQSRRKTTSSISSIRGEDLAGLPVASVDIMLQGRLPGINVLNSSGEPGKRTNLMIRGNTAVGQYLEDNSISSPLYIIDGMPLLDNSTAENNREKMQFSASTQTSVIAGIPVEDIESIDVLKDAAAAAIYGSRAANGIILIKTKRAKGGPPKLSLNSSVGVTLRPQFNKVIGGAEERRQKMEFLKKYSPETLDNLPYFMTDSLYDKLNNSTNWQDLKYRDGIVQNHSLAVSGGSESANYRATLGYYNEDGIQKSSGFVRYNFGINSNFRFSERFTLQADLALNRMDRKRGAGLQESAGSAELSPNMIPSSLVPYDQLINFETLAAFNVKDRNYDNTVRTNIQGVLSMLKNNNLRLNSRIGVSYNTARRERFTPGELAKAAVPSLISSEMPAMANAFYSNQDNTTLTNENFITYQTRIGHRHNLTVVAGQSLEYYQYGNVKITALRGLNDHVEVIQGYANQDISTITDEQRSGLLSFYGRLNYDFKDRYLLSLTWRTDGSSKFGANNRWGTFPSIAGGWIVSDEPFFKFKPVSYLKFRGSYGINGQQPRDIYKALGVYTIQPEIGFGQVNDLLPYPTYAGMGAVTPNFADGISNPNLKWEESKQWNAGVDMYLLDQRIEVTFDAYDRKTDNMFWLLDLPVSSGYGKLDANTVGVRNYGWELMVTSRNLNPRSALQWRTTFNISRNRNIVTKLPSTGKLVRTSATYHTLELTATDPQTYGSGLTVGRPLNQHYIYISDGIYQNDSEIPVNPYTGQRLTINGYEAQPGDPKFRDLNGDFNINSSDKQFFGDPNSAYYGGLGNTFTWKQFSLDVFCTFNLGRKIINGVIPKRFSGSVENFIYGSLQGFDDVRFWEKEGDQGTLPKFRFTDNKDVFRAEQVAFVENGDFLRLSTVMLGYALSPQALKKIKMAGLRFYVNAYNLAILQKYSGRDAENVSNLGIDNGGIYPQPKKFTVGLAANF